MDEPTRVSDVRRSTTPGDPFRFEDGDGWMEQIRSAQSTGLGRIGPFEIIEEVGRGAQGIVYRARQPNTNRQIAVKRLIAGGLASATARRRFEREVEAVSALNHPGIVIVYGLEVIDDAPLLAMEWVDGVPAHRWALEGEGKPRDATEILHVFLRICDAMQHAHSRGVIHRDLKPANILVVEGSGFRVQASGSVVRSSLNSEPRTLNPQPKILDFGLAKLVDPDHAGPQMTHSDEFVGTPAYAAPEQVRLEHEAVDVRTDVYSLGVVLFQMLTGVMPYEISRNLMTLIETIQHTAPARPSARNPKLGREIDTIVLKALAKEPEGRYQTVDALAEDIRRFLAGDPILAHPPRATYYLKKMLWRYRVAATIAGGLMACIVVVGIVAIVFWFRAQRGEDSARLENQSLRGLLKVLSSAFGNIHRAVEENEPVNIVGSLESARRKIVDGFVGGQEALPSIDAGLAAVYAHIGELDRSEKGYRAVLQLLREQNRADSIEFAACEGELARLLDQRGESVEAEALFREAWRIQAAQKGRNHQDVAMTMNDLAVALMNRGRVVEAKSLLEQALEIHTRLSVASERDRGILHLNLAQALARQGNGARSQQELAASLEAFRRLKFHRFEEYASALVASAQLAAQSNQLDAARRQLEEALAVRRECLGEWHPRVADVSLWLAEILVGQGRLDEAMDRGRDALAIRRLTRGDDDESTIAVQRMLAACEAARTKASQPATPATMPTE